MVRSARIYCIGGVLWDVIGRSPHGMRTGSDEPGRITRLPGGVALNIAMTLRRFDLSPGVLGAVGRDREGDALIAALDDIGLETAYLHRTDHPTDQYLAIEDRAGLVAAVADAHSLEAAGDAILTPLFDGRLGSAAAPFTGTLAIDGNLTVELLTEIAGHPAFASADLRVAPASPGKARRLTPLLTAPNATIYVNLVEAGAICDMDFGDAREAAETLVGHGAARVLVTDGGRTAAEAGAHGVRLADPPRVDMARVTGAGDTFMAAHIAAELLGQPNALKSALATAAAYVAGEF